MILEPIHDSRASFYGKAFVNIHEDDKVTHKELISYNTLVANYVFYKKERKIVYEYLGNYSCTTTRHQKEFFKQLGLTDKDIKELFKKGKLEIQL